MDVTENGCTSAATVVPATIYPIPVASYSAIPSLCIGATTNVNFNGIAGGTATYNWNFNGATVNSGSAAGPYNVQWNAAGNYNVTLTVTENGCSNTTSSNVSINPIPTATFNATPAVCANDPIAVNYTGTGTAGGTYNWNFNGATINSGSGSGPYTISFSTGGAYNVSLTVTENGCTSTPLAQAVNITDFPVPSISSMPSLCVNAANVISYSGSALGTAAYTWNWNGGTVASGSGAGPYSVSWATPGNYNVNVSVNQNGCIASTSVPIVVNAIPTSNFIITPAACANTPVNASYTGTGTAGATYTWDFTGATVVSGSGGGPYTLNYASGGAYNVSLTVSENGCVGAPINLPVSITNAPIATFTATPSLCINAANTISFTGSVIMTALVNWNFDGGTVISGTGTGPYQISWPTPGNYNVSLSIDQNGCVASSSIPVTVYNIPTSDFTITPSACTSDPININYIGTGTPGSTYNWSFTGATVNSGTGVGPYVLNYASGGAYTVSLTVSENGCVGAPINLPVNITQVPTASITATPSLCVNADNNIIFTGTALPMATYNWNFNGGNIASGSSGGPYTINWSTPGTYNVSVSVDQNGCIAQTSFPVTVFAIPTSDFNITPAVCLGNTVTVNYTGSGTVNSNYNWNFNGGAIVSGTGSGPYTLQYNNPGNNPVTLVVDENGCVSTVMLQQTTINPIPTVEAGNNAIVCSGVLVSVGDPNPVAGAIYQWSPATYLANANSPSTTVTLVNSTITTQQIDYTLLVTDANGCTNSDMVRVSAYPQPVVNFNNQGQQCLDNNNFIFAAIANIPSGMNYSWSFPGGNPASSTQSSQDVTYAATGTYQITLNADYNGCIAPVYTDTVRVNEMPVSDFIPQVFNGCQPLTVPFSNLSIGFGNSYSWNFFDNTPINYSDNPTHVFNTPGTFSVSLVASNVFGCKANITYPDIITVYPEAVARFTPNPSVANVLAPAFQFQNYSTNSATYSWDFGDGDSAFIRNPSHSYVDTGSYNVMLIVTSPDGCIDTIAGVVRVEDNFAFYIPNAFSPNGDGVNDSFRGFGVAIRAFSMSIYNRWGELIYRTNDYNQPWDGKVKDTVQNDVYVYRIEVVDHHEEKHVYLGNVSVVR